VSSKAEHFGLQFITDTLHTYTLHTDNWDAVEVVTRTGHLKLRAIYYIAYCMCVLPMG